MQNCYKRSIPLPSLVTRTSKRKSHAVIIRSSTPHATDLPINNNNTSHYYSASTSDSPVTYSSPPYFLGIKIQNLHCRDTRRSFFSCFRPAHSPPLFSFACVVWWCGAGFAGFSRAAPAQPSRGDGDVIFTKFTTSKPGRAKRKIPHAPTSRKPVPGKFEPFGGVGTAITGIRWYHPSVMFELLFRKGNESG